MSLFEYLKTHRADQDLFDWAVGVAVAIPAAAAALVVTGIFQTLVYMFQAWVFQMTGEAQDGSGLIGLLLTIAEAIHPLLPLVVIYMLPIVAAGMAFYLTTVETSSWSSGRRAARRRRLAKAEATTED